MKDSRQNVEKYGAIVTTIQITMQSEPSGYWGDVLLAFASQKFDRRNSNS